MKNTESAIPFDTLKKYIKYAKAKVQPRLSVKASDDLISQYVNDRQKSYEQSKLRKSTNNIPITVRQLEAVIRLSESLARMKLKQEVGSEEVEAAHYLFEISTIKTIEGSHEFGYNLSEGISSEVQKAEEAIRKKVCLGNQVSTINLLNDLENKYSRTIANHAVFNMIRNQ